MENIEMDYKKHKELFQKNPKYIISPELGKTVEDVKAKNHQLIDLLPESYFFQDIERYRSRFLPFLDIYKKYFYSDQSYLSLYYGVGAIKWRILYCLNRFEGNFKILLEVHKLSNHYYLFLHLLTAISSITASFTDETGTFNPLKTKKRKLKEIKDFFNQLHRLEEIRNAIWPPILVKEEDGEIILESLGKELKAITFKFLENELSVNKTISNPILMTQFIENGFHEEMRHSFYLYKERIDPTLIKIHDVYTFFRKELAFMIYTYLSEETRLRPPNNQTFSSQIDAFIVDYFEMAGLKFTDNNYSSKLITDKSIKMALVKSWIQSKIKQNTDNH